MQLNLHVNYNIGILIITDLSSREQYNTKIEILLDSP